MSILLLEGRVENDHKNARYAVGWSPAAVLFQQLGLPLLWSSHLLCCLFEHVKTDAAKICTQANSQNILARMFVSAGCTCMHLYGTHAIYDIPHLNGTSMTRYVPQRDLRVLHLTLCHILTSYHKELSQVRSIWLETLSWAVNQYCAV